MSWAVWLTGVPGSGKSTLARAVADRLAGMGQSVTVLELDRMRRFVTPAPTSSDAERDVVYRALVWVAASLTEAGLPVVIDATAHRRQWRDLARAVIPRFAEVHVTCPLEVATTREQRRRGGAAPPGIYARAGRPGARVPGIDVPYEPPLAPDLVVDGAGEPIDRAAERVTAMALGLAGAGAHPAPADRWVIWITGRPGSGKSTLACGAAERLQSDGIPIKLLAFADLRALLAPGYTPPAADEILHRAVIYAARLLTRAGVAVIVDATAPRLAWRKLARQAIARFAEVQLLCPAEVCMTRERAVRWGRPGLRAPRRAGGAAPDIVGEYETSPGAEVTVSTHVESAWSATDAVVRLARRLHRTTVSPEEKPCTSSTS